MVFPLVPIAVGLMAGGTAVNGAFSLWKGQETRQFWSDYAKHTRRKVKYPNRAGYNDIYYAVGSTMRGAGASAFAGYSAYRGTPYGGYGFGRGSRDAGDVMFR